MDNPNVYSVEFKLAKVAEFAKSGMTIKAFALANGISDKTFWCWVEKARESGVPGLPPKIEQPMMIPSFSPVDITKNVKGAKRGPKASSKASCKVDNMKFSFPSEMLIDVIRELQPK
jgi:transposase-like protein